MAEQSAQNISLPIVLLTDSATHPYSEYLDIITIGRYKITAQTTFLTLGLPQLSNRLLCFRRDSTIFITELELEAYLSIFSKLLLHLSGEAIDFKLSDVIVQDATYSCHYSLQTNSDSYHLELSYKSQSETVTIVFNESETGLLIIAFRDIFCKIFQYSSYIEFYINFFVKYAPKTLLANLSDIRATENISWWLTSQLVINNSDLYYLTSLIIRHKQLILPWRKLFLFDCEPGKQLF